MLPFVLLLTVLFRLAEPSIRHTVSRRDPASHRLYDDHVLWDSSTRTLRECSVLCATDDRCSAFTLVKNSSQSARLCRGYSADALILNEGSFSVFPRAVLFQVSARWASGAKAEQLESSTQLSSLTSTNNMEPSTSEESLSSFDGSSSAVPSTEQMTSRITTENVDVSSADSTSPTEEETTTVAEPTEPATQTTMSTMMTLAETTTVAWFNTQCSSDGDCTQQQSDTICSSGTCICSPGYFYSVSRGTCNVDCPPEDLTTTYTRYRNRVIISHDDDVQSVGSLDECFNYCNGNSNCRSIDFQQGLWGSKKCYMSFTVALGMGILAFPSNFPGFDHYQRQCL